MQFSLNLSVWSSAGSKGAALIYTCKELYLYFLLMAAPELSGQVTKQKKRQLGNKPVIEKVSFYYQTVSGWILL